MFGIVLASHGKTAEGMIDGAKLIFGEQIEQIESVSIENEGSPAEFLGAMKAAIERTNSGEGVVLLVDFFGGTPCNQSPYCANEQVQIITGMNMPVLLELLGMRSTTESVREIDFCELIEKGRAGITHLNALLDHTDGE